MSDLAATNCGCGCEDRCGCDREESCGCGGGLMNSFGNGSSCSCILWLIILMSFCGNSGFSGGFGCNHGGCGCADNSCLLLIILLLCCGGGC